MNDGPRHQEDSNHELARIETPNITYLPPAMTPVEGLPPMMTPADANLDEVPHPVNCPPARIQFLLVQSWLQSGPENLDQQ